MSGIYLLINYLRNSLPTISSFMIPLHLFPAKYLLLKKSKKQTIFIKFSKIKKFERFEIELTKLW